LTLLFIQNKNKLWTINDDLMKKRNKITFNLSLCLLIADLLIIFGMNKTDIDPKVQKMKVFLKVYLNLFIFYSVVVRIILRIITLFIVIIVCLDVC
jgi:hypothetical protein